MRPPSATRRMKGPRGTVCQPQQGLGSDPTCSKWPNTRRITSNRSHNVSNKRQEAAKDPRSTTAAKPRIIRSMDLAIRATIGCVNDAAAQRKVAASSMSSLGMGTCESCACTCASCAVVVERSKWGDVGGLSAARWSRVAPEGWGRGAEGGLVGWLLVVCIDRARRGTALSPLSASLSLFLSRLPRLSFSARNVHLPTRCFGTVHHFSLTRLFSVSPSRSRCFSPSLDRCPRHDQAATVPESTNDSELRSGEPISSTLRNPRSHPLPPPDARQISVMESRSQLCEHRRNAGSMQRVDPKDRAQRQIAIRYRLVSPLSSARVSSRPPFRSLYSLAVIAALLSPAM